MTAFLHYRSTLLAGACLAFVGIGLALPSAAAAQDQAGPQTAQQSEGQGAAEAPDPAASQQSTLDPGPIPNNEIIVSGARLRGQLDVEQAPLLELDEAAIAAEGVASIADLVSQIQNQTGSSRGRGGGGFPVILVNGIRPGSFRELFSYPPEALAKVEVFPEEVALRFGFPPDRRVINLILKEDYASREVEFEFEGPARGDSYTREQEFGYLKIKDGGRINVNLTANDTSFLTEAERSIIQTPGSTSQLMDDPEQAEFRSLIADSRSLEANVSWAKAYLDSGVQITANANYERQDSRSLQGLNTVLLEDGAGNALLRTFGEETPLEQTLAQDTFSASGSLAKPVNAFKLTSTFDAGLTEREQRIDARFDTDDLEAAALNGALALDGALPVNADAGFDTARLSALNASTLNTLRGPVANLPGGEVLATFDLGYDWSNIEASDTRGGLPVDLTRGEVSTGVNLTIPITSRRTGFADWLGSFTLNTEAGIQELSDFGTLGNYTASLNWAPTGKLDLSASYIYREVAPGLRALGDPLVEQLNVPVFDLVSGDTVLADVTTGGNAALPAETQRDWKFAVNWELPVLDGTRLTVEYVRNRSDDVTSAFPQITEAIEAAFPDRITRDQTGRLVAIDRRAVAFAETRNNYLQFRLFKRGSFGMGEAERGGRGSGNRGGNRGSGQGEGQKPASTKPDSGQQGASNSAGPAASRQERFAEFRQRFCNDDGAEAFAELAARIERGEDISDAAPGIPSAFLERFLSRVRGTDGSIDPQKLEAARERICSMGGGAGNGGAAQSGDGSGGQQSGGQQSGGRSGGPPAAAFNPIAQRPGWRYFISFTHTIQLDNEILIAPGVPVLDQLNGDATGAFGLARHNSRLEAGIFGNGAGLRLSGNYIGEARLNGSELPGSTDLFFDDLATFDIRLFANLDEITGSNSPVLDKLRISLRMDNVFEAQRDVRDESGEVPINYQPFLIDPVGRFIGIDLRKLF